MEGLSQWIDGSFITNKLNPRDIDFVTFVDWKIFEEKQSDIDHIRQYRFAEGLGMDGYFVAIYPENHKKHILYQADKLQWLYQFGRSRDDKQKGFIQLNFWAMEKKELDQLHDWGLRVSRLLELIALTNRTLHLHQEEGGSTIQISDYQEMLSQHQAELNNLMRTYGLHVQITPLENAA